MTQAQSKSYGGVKKKLMGAVCMLLVASIMMVSSTYAWFTLSTAPEITGISTSVGANGNLEMALLNTQTFANTDQIKSAVGDSMDNKAENWTVQQANLTWGNLVDLTTGYGLETIKLMPAAANYTDESKSQLNRSNLLATAVYGKDGRVEKTEGNTNSGTYDTKTQKWSAANNTYGVRVVGVSSTMSDKEMGYNAAKSAYTAALGSAHAGMTAAILNNVAALAGMTGDTLVTTEQQEAALAVLNGAESDLNTLVTAYKSYIIGTAAANTSLDDAAFTTLREAVNKMTAAQLAAGASTYNTYLPNGATTQISAISSMLEKVTAAKATVTKSVETSMTAGAVKTAIADVVGTNPGLSALGSGNTYNWPDGAVGTIAGTIGEYVLIGNVPLIGGTIKGGTAGTQAVLELGTLQNAQFTASGESSITDTYGYVLDMAFRTNAATSYLKLQTAEAQRVYSDSDSEATRGGGSNMTFTYGNDVTAAQAEKLMKAVRVVFFDPASGTVYATAKLDAVDTSTTGTAKADLKLDATGGTTDKIVDMNQNTATKVSVLVYLDGESIDNSAVSNGAQTGTSMKLNLQFSSSATLTPMENSALRNMKKPAIQP